jgi:ABC-type transporter Mla maintaining outer membrane lipid asymmetry permease subunit MlaE
MREVFTFISDIVSTFGNFGAMLFTPLSTLIADADSPILDAFLTGLESVGLGDFLSTTLGAFVFGSILILVLAINLIVWLIP